MPRSALPPAAPLLVLCLDEGGAVGNGLHNQLAQFGIEVISVGGLAELQERLRRGSFSALLCDPGLEHDDLLRALARLRLEGATIPPLIAQTGRDSFAVRRRAVNAGAVAFLPRPFDIPAIVDTLFRISNPHSESAYQVMIVDDSPSSARYHAGLLEGAGMLVRVITDPLLVFDALLEKMPDLVVLDIHMPGCEGPELAAVLRQDSRFLSLPIVFLSGETDTALQIDALEFGADDLLTKPVQPDYFVSSVAVRCGRYRDLRSRMTQDSLTGLLNHSSFEERLQLELKRAQRQRYPMSVAMIDIDHFKRVNDQYGHPAGDQVIRSLSRLLQRRLRNTDLISRYGGEEFALALPDTPLEEAGQLLDQIRAAFAQIEQESSEAPFRCSISCGVATYPEAAASQLVECADQALYAAKKNGRNRIMLWRRRQDGSTRADRRDGADV
jgi:diguanylate cyclase (GGDEF)-like protein